MGRSPPCWQHPCMGMDAKIFPPRQVLQHLAAGEMGTSLDQASPPHCPLFASPCELSPGLRDTKKQLSECGMGPRTRLVAAG